MKDYSEAKKEVDNGRTTWEELEELGLAAPKASSMADAIKKAREKKKDGG